MLYCTQALGLGAKYAGLMLSITLIWGAMADPIMGQITDNTRSRFGRRHGYILTGGLAMGLCFCLLWTAPSTFTQHSAEMLFWCLLLINLLVRTSLAVFIVPYGALGFEICTTYDERSKLQSVLYFFFQVANLAGGALAWLFFFRDRTGPSGERIDGTRFIENYDHMGITLCIAILLLVCLCVFGTRYWATDNRSVLAPHNSLRTFFRDQYAVLSDRHALHVFAFSGMVMLGCVMVSQAQMYTYVNFMKFGHVNKTIVHGAGMGAFAIGALLQSALVGRFDKKRTGYFGVLISTIGGMLLLLVFVGGVLPTEESWTAPDTLPLIGGSTVPVSAIAFAVLQGMWWCGMGVLAPLTSSMIADVSEINYRRTGLSKDGSYFAILALFNQVASGVAMLVNGLALESIGIVGADSYSTAGAHSIAILTFVSGPVLCAFALPFLWTYRVDREYMDQTSRTSRLTV